MSGNDSNKRTTNLENASGNGLMESVDRPPPIEKMPSKVQSF